MQTGCEVISARQAESSLPCNLRSHPALACLSVGACVRIARNIRNPTPFFCELPENPYAKQPPRLLLHSLCAEHASRPRPLRTLRGLLWTEFAPRPLSPGTKASHIRRHWVCELSFKTGAPPSPRRRVPNFRSARERDGLLSTSRQPRQRRPTAGFPLDAQDQ